MKKNNNLPVSNLTQLHKITTWNREHEIQTPRTSLSVQAEEPLHPIEVHAILTSSTKTTGLNIDYSQLHNVVMVELNRIKVEGTTNNPNASGVYQDSVFYLDFDPFSSSGENDFKCNVLHTGNSKRSRAMIPIPFVREIVTPGTSTFNAGFDYEYKNPIILYRDSLMKGTQINKIFIDLIRENGANAVYTKAYLWFTFYVKTLK